MNRVMVQPNPIKEEAVQVSRKLVSLLLREEFEVLALEEFRQVLCRNPLKFYSLSFCVQR